MRLTVTPHAHGEALLEATVLAAVAVVLGHLAVLAAAARVAELLANGALEEALAALAADRPVVAPRGPVAAHDAVLDGQGHRSAARRLVRRDKTQCVHLHWASYCVCLLSGFQFRFEAPSGVDHDLYQVQAKKK